jgi:hypothetical protein
MVTSSEHEKHIILLFLEKKLLEKKEENSIRISLIWYEYLHVSSSVAITSIAFSIFFFAFHLFFPEVNFPNLFFFWWRIWNVTMGFFRRYDVGWFFFFRGFEFEGKFNLSEIHVSVARWKFFIDKVSVGKSLWEFWKLGWSKRELFWGKLRETPEKLAKHCGTWNFVETLNSKISTQISNRMIKNNNFLSVHNSTFETVNRVWGNLNYRKNEVFLSTKKSRVLKSQFKEKKVNNN